MPLQETDRIQSLIAPHRNSTSLKLEVLKQAIEKDFVSIGSRSVAFVGFEKKRESNGFKMGNLIIRVNYGGGFEFINAIPCFYFAKITRHINIVASNELAKKLMAQYGIDQTTYYPLVVHKPLSARPPKYLLIIVFVRTSDLKDFLKFLDVVGEI